MAGIAPMPTIGGSAANLNADVTDLAPLATTWSGPSTGVQIAQNIHQASTSTAGPSNLSSLGNFFTSTISSIGHIATGAATWLAKNTVQMGEGVAHFPGAVYHGIDDDIHLDRINAQNTQNDNQLETLDKQFNSGKISHDAYTQGLKEVTKNISNLSATTRATALKTNTDSKDVIQDSIDAGSAVVTIMTAGFGDPESMALGKTAADYFASKSAVPLLGNVEDGLNRLATDPEALAKLDPDAQKVIQGVTAEVVAKAAPTMTGSQIARTAATNLALKYPIYYQAMDSTAKQLYTQLDTAKYGDAMRTLAFNAALLISGGPIGKALDVLKGTTGLLSKYAFGQSSFWDETSKYFDQGQTDGFAKAIQEKVTSMAPDEAKDYIHNLSAVEATNLHAVGGDAIAAANRFAVGMKSYEGLDTHTITHADALDNMVEFAKAQREATEAAAGKGLGPVTVGRVDARDLQTIAQKLSAGSTVAERLQIWDKLKGQNITRAWANNGNFDAQVKGLIQKYDDSPALTRQIKQIKAAFEVKGFPKNVADSLAKRGYLPIKPINLQAPFKEGTDKLLTRYADVGTTAAVRDTAPSALNSAARNAQNDFFLKAVQPLPILGHIGGLLTQMGLSPQASTQRVYQIFHDTLTDNLQASQVLKKYGDNLVAQQRLIDDAKTTGKMTATELETIKNNAADSMIKKLSDFAHNPTRGGLRLGDTTVRPPIVDLRQLTTKDIQSALGVGFLDAREVRGALMDSMLQVPLSVTGVGDKLIALNYKLNPTASEYSRLQGAFRFAWNPIFAAKLDIKSEILTQADAGGHFPTLIGTNWLLKSIFPDKYRQLDAISDALRQNGIFDTRGPLGKASVVGGEGVIDSGEMSSNLTHKLLPGQERSIAALVSTQADKVGMNVHDFIANYPHEVADTVQAIAQYDRHNSFLNSPLMRTMNLAFFPMRFETKVASLMAKSLAKTSLMTQFAVIKGLYNGTEWLQSPVGQAWYAQNADVIGMLDYFTPLSALSTVAEVLGTHGETVGAYGELGGLPFGFIPAMTDAAGLTHFGTTAPLVSSKTGEVVPNYVPTNTRGRIQLAIEDLLSGIFTYPGATIGLPSKTGITSKIAKGLVPGSASTDFQTVTPNITPEQQKYQKLVQSLHPDQEQPQSLPEIQQGLNNGIQVPASPTPATTPYSNKGTSDATSSKTKKKTKAEFTPELLPGQTSLGQL